MRKVMASLNSDTEQKKLSRARQATVGGVREPLFTTVPLSSLVAEMSLLPPELHANSLCRSC